MSAIDLSNFPASSYKQWTEHALKEMKAEGLDSLKWAYDPDVILGPYYDQEQAIAPGPSGLSTELLPDLSEGRMWHYLEPVVASQKSDDALALNERALEALNAGADGIFWELKHIANMPAEHVFRDIAFKHCQTVFKSEQWSKTEEEFFKGLFSINSEVVHQIPGFLVLPPPSHAEEALNIEAFFAAATGFRPHCFEALSASSSSLSPSGQIAYLLSQFIERAKWLVPAGASMASIIQRSVFCVSIGRDFFHEIAKIRALKIVLSQAANHFGSGKVLPSDIKIFAEPNRNTHSVVDPYVNMVRLTAAAVAAINGGANYVSLSGFDDRHAITTKGFSSRMSRNISNLLKDESHLDKHADPSSGSYFIEKLTAALAATGWKKMQEAERAGGFSATATSQYWENQAIEFKEKEKQSIERRKLTFVGVNNYCDLSLFDAFPSTATYKSEETLLSSFELMRIKVEDFLSDHPDDSRPMANTILFGDPSSSLARFGFVKGLFPSAGIDVKEPLRWPIMNKLKNAEAVKLLILCASDADYASDGPGIVAEIVKLFPSAHIVVAGNPADGQQKLVAAGVDSFIHVKSNFIDALSSYQKLFGI